MLECVIFSERCSSLTFSLLSDIRLCSASHMFVLLSLFDYFALAIYID